jgi:hypothetical protein
MDGMLIDGRIGRLWMCKKNQGHALGIVLSMAVDGHYVDRLALFDEAVVTGDLKQEKTFCLPQVNIIGYVEGTMENIKCSCCKSERTWWMGEAALERFMSARRERRKKVMA